MGALVLVTAAALWLSVPEPEYRGWTLSMWIDHRTRASLVTDKEREEAIRHIGTNGLPSLMRWIRYNPPLWGRVASASFRKLHLSDDFVGERESRGFDAAWAFSVLGPEALPAAPELAGLLGSPDVNVRYRAGVALGGVGQGALSFLLSVATNRQDALDLTVLFAAWSILGTNAAPAIPTLIGRLRNPDQAVAGTSAALLGISATQPETVVPALSEAAGGTNAHVRVCAVEAFSAFGQSARGAVPVLVRALGDGDTAVREAATNSLRKVAPEMLLEAMKEHGN